MDLKFSKLARRSQCVLLLMLSILSSNEADNKDDNILVKVSFTRDVFNASIPENSIGKTYVTPEDRKMGISLTSTNTYRIRYKILSGDNDRFFKAEERLVGNFWFLLLRIRTGNTAVLNRERKDKYTLDVRGSVYENENTQNVLHECKTTVMVSIMDRNDMMPLFYPTEYEEVVNEDLAVHASITKVFAEDADLGVNGEIYYSLSLNTMEQFAINPSTGVVTLTRPLNYQEKSKHVLMIFAQDRGMIVKGVWLNKTSTAKLTICVRPANLHDPKIQVEYLSDVLFVDQLYSDEVYAIIKVTDKDDTGNNGKIKSVEIADGDFDAYFTLKKITTQPESSQHYEGEEYFLSVSKLIHRKDAVYSLKIIATDKGIPERRSVVNITVNVMNAVKITPTFDKEMYEVSVYENVPVNTPVIRLKTNNNSSSNQLADVEIVAGNEGGEFYVNRKTGMLYSSKLLDCERKSLYTLSVSIEDHKYNLAGKQQQTSAKVKIQLIDVNDNNPTFDIDEREININENEPIGSYVTKVTARDKDSGENGYISYSISNINVVPFMIDHFTGVVTTTEVLDYETSRREWTLYVRASDWGVPYRRQSEMKLTVHVRDINDNRPIFERVNCSGYLPRTLPVNTEILSLTAVDFDSGNIISYRISSAKSGKNDCFKIDMVSGIVTLLCDLTKVGVDDISLNVTATDGIHLSDVTRIHVELIDAVEIISSTLWSPDNDKFDCTDTGVSKRLKGILAQSNRNNKNLFYDKEDISLMPIRYGENVHHPELINFPNRVLLNESIPIGTTVVRIHGTDRDLGYNGQLFFSISSRNNESLFLIDSDTGMLKTIGILDYEIQNMYNLNITLYDQGSPQKSISNILEIIIIDNNDNSPIFNNPISRISIKENIENNTIIFKAIADDIDQGENAKIYYQLLNDGEDFRIHENSGDLFVYNKLNRETRDNYELKIRAMNKENGIPTLFSDSLLLVKLEDVNDNKPVFHLKSFTVKIREDIPIGTVVSSVTASDADLNENGEIRYSLITTDNSDCFKIDDVTGTVRILCKLDYEQRQLYELSVRADDSGTPSLWSETKLRVLIVDVNENLHAPQFDELVIASAVLENQPPGAFVTQVTAVDNDPSGDDSRITYSIRGGDGIGYFSIDNEAWYYSVENSVSHEQKRRKSVKPGQLLTSSQTAIATTV